MYVCEPAHLITSHPRTRPTRPPRPRRAAGIFKSGDPARRARAIVQAVTHYNNPKILSEVSGSLGEPMVGIDIREKGFNSYAQRSE